ncbi:MAG: hypothetical protein HYV09_11385 [Deltaproteobacteria bacterium]|nr:hypothetical protein [Deltaproteobacteria bacterium]
MQRRVIVLVGPKGAGKSTIGALIERELGVAFVRVEPIFLRVREAIGADHPELERRGFQAVREALVEALRSHEAICFESTGASRETAPMLEELSRHAHMLPVQVTARPEQYLPRVRSRDLSIHIPVSDDRVEEINARAAEVELAWAARIDNSGAFDPEAILAKVRDLLEA